MHRFHVPCAAGETWRERAMLPPSESHHATNVLRIREGETVGLLDGAGHSAEAVVENVHKRGVLVRITERHSQPEPPVNLVLFQSVIKGKQMEWLVQKATELGASHIVPVITDRSVVHLEAKRAEAKADKWHAVAVEAIKQCGSLWLPQVGDPVRLCDLLAKPDALPELNLVGSLADSPKTIREVLDADTEARGRLATSIGLWIGPEGDFTEGEYDALAAVGARQVTFGPLVLRAETAGIFALSVVGYEVRCRLGH